MAKRAAVALEILAAVLLGAALTAAYAGPLRFDLLGASISIRTLSRPILAALVLLALRLWLLGNPVLSAAARTLARVTSGALIAAGVLGWFTYLSTTCGGTDSYGYVSAAERLLAADLVQDEPLASMMPFASGISAACPLGYVPSPRVANASVPFYPLGLPATMAAATVLFGRAGPYFVAPLLGLVLLAASYMTTLSWYRDRHTALLACGLLALHPLVFTYAIQPMSDVPAAATVMVAVAALSGAPSWPVIGGLAAGLTLLIRPALAPAALALALVPLTMDRARRIGSTVRYLVPVGAAIGLQAWIQWYLYGGALSTSYDVAGLFSANIVLFNVRSYSYWGLLTLGPVWMACVAIGIAISDRLPRLVLAVITASVLTLHLFYGPYDHWETLRFLLPILVVATIVAAAGLLHVARRTTGEAVGALLASGVAVAVTYSWMSWLTLNNVFTMPNHEARHRTVAELVAQVTPRDAVVMALQHSGTIRLYAGRQTLNWDQIPAGSFRATVKALQNRDFVVYLVIDSDQERAMFHARHGGVVEDDRWLPSGQRRNVQMFEAPPLQ